MNLDDLLDAGKEHIATMTRDGLINVPDDCIIFPQTLTDKTQDKQFSDQTALYVEITAAESDRWAATDRTERVMVVVNFIVAVWLGSGTARAHNVASRIADSFTVISGRKSTMKTKNGKVLRVVRVSQEPPFPQSQTYRVDSRVEFETAVS